MPSSITFGLCLMFSTMLLIFAEQGTPQSRQYNQQSAHSQGPEPTCCTTASNVYIKQTINSCYEQKANTLPNCAIHAYMFITDAGPYCVNANAQWVEKRLQKLKEKGIVCKVLGKVFHTKNA